MIDTAISLLANELNEFLKRTFDMNEDVVVISNVLEQDGTVASHVNNKVVVSLIKIEKDTVPFRKPDQIDLAAERVIQSAVPLYFNLYLMFAACFSGNNYREGLKFISNTINFFQRQPVFDRQNTPDLNENIDKLLLNIENLSIHDLSSLWGMLSGKYLPSIIYKVRMVAFDAGDVNRQRNVMRKPQTAFHH